MALSNAERQRRYRQRLKARASGEAAGELVRAMVERATAALWAIHARAAGPGTAHLVQSPGEFRARLARQPGGLLSACRKLMENPFELAQQDRQLLACLLEIDAALRLQPPPRHPAD